MRTLIDIQYRPSPCDNATEHNDWQSCTTDPDNREWCAGCRSNAASEQRTKNDGASNWAVPLGGYHA